MLGLFGRLTPLLRKRSNRMARAITMGERVVRIETTLERVAIDLDRVATAMEKIVPEIARLSAENRDLREAQAKQQSEIDSLKDFKRRVMAWAAVISTGATLLVTFAAESIKRLLG